MTTTTESIVVMQDVATLVDGKREKIGEYPCLVPLLNAFGIDAAVVLGADGQPKLDESGLPEYSDQRMAWLFNAVTNYAKTAARNLLQPKTADLLTGRTWPASVDELTTPAVRSGSAALAERAALFSLWGSFVDSLGRQPAVAALAKAFMKQPDSVVAQPQKVKDAVVGWLSAFIDAHGAELTDYQVNHVSSVITACETDAANLEW